MNNTYKNTLDAFVTMREFDTQNSSDYAAVADASAQFGVLDEVIEAMENHAAAQISGRRSRAVEQKKKLLESMDKKMKKIIISARGLNITDEGFQRLFHLPTGTNEQKILAAARDFAEQAEIYKEDFVRLAMPKTFVADLNADIEAFETALNDKASAQSSRVGATAGIKAEAARGMKARIVLNAIIQNVYADNPTKLAEWMQAQHIRNVPKKTNRSAKPDKIEKSQFQEQKT